MEVDENLMDKERLIDLIKNYQPTKARNSMGCSEGWYDFVFAMKQTFSIEEIENMSQHEIDLLGRLHDATAEGLY